MNQSEKKTNKKNRIDLATALEKVLKALRIAKLFYRIVENVIPETLEAIKNLLEEILRC
jgi:hypothetical protein